MSAVKIGAMDRRVQFQRATMTDDGVSQVENWANHGAPVWARRRDVSDGEKMRAAQMQAAIMARFTVRYSTFTDEITPKDRLVCDNLTWDITGVKQIERSGWLEITATARLDA